MISSPLTYSWKHTVTSFVKNPDEIVLENVRLFHYETMEEGRHVWIGIYGNDGKIYHMNINGDNLKVYYSDESSWLKTFNNQMEIS